MTDARSDLGNTIAAIGALVVADTLLLLYQMRVLFPSQGFLSLTAAFLVFQEACFFGLLVYIAKTTGRNSVALPVQLGYVSVFAASFVCGIVWIAVFAVLLTFGLLDSSTFWAVLASRQIGLLVLLLAIRSVGIVHQAASQEAEQKRSSVEELVRACGRIAVSSRLAGWDLDERLKIAGERLRFCEALRRDPVLAGEVSARLSDLEVLVRHTGDGESKTRANGLLDEVLVLSSHS